MSVSLEETFRFEPPLDQVFDSEYISGEKFIVFEGEGEFLVHVFMDHFRSHLEVARDFQERKELQDSNFMGAGYISSIPPDELRCAYFGEFIFSDGEEHYIYWDSTTCTGAKPVGWLRSYGKDRPEDSARAESLVQQIASALEEHFTA